MIGKRNIVGIFLLAISQIICAQDCDWQSLERMYNKYRARFNRSFVVMDRDANGRIQDGIGQNVTNPCEFSKSGYSLPATSIIISWSGTEAMENRSSYYGVTPLNDPDCGNWMHWDQSKGTRFNYLDMGSETPTQLGWYMVMLSLEYERYRLQGQDSLQLIALEELFLALQAVRRLDMQAQCMAEKIYNRAKEKKGAQLCEEFYEIQKGNTEIHSFMTSGIYAQTCPFVKQMDGYYGFFIREDATQQLTQYVHDSSKQCYQIDAIKSCFSRTRPPCTLSSFVDDACYLYREQGFMSQDQILGLLNGFAFIKRYIPDSAVVKVSTGQEYKVLPMAIRYAKNLVDRIDNNYKNRITFPGILDCVEGLSEKERKDKLYLSNFEGGQTDFIIYGIKKACEFITGSNMAVTQAEKRRWNIYIQWCLLSPSNASFYILLHTIIGDEPDNSFVAFCLNENKEIYLLQYALLHPEWTREILSHFNEKELQNYLCSSPENGHCTQQRKYPPEETHIWPEFHCEMVPGWLGQRWDGKKRDDEVIRIFNEKNKDAYPPNKIYNGLDFMNLYNMFMVLYQPVQSASKR